MSLNHLQNVSTADIYTDLNGLQNLKTSARKDSQAALPEVARQFESVMISMMIKNLRKTGMDDPIFKSQAMDSYRDMYDQQLGMELSKGQGIGLAKSIVAQLQHQAGEKLLAPTGERLASLKMPERQTFPAHYSSLAKNTLAENNASQNTEKSDSYQAVAFRDLDAEFSSPKHFVEKLWPLAEKAANKLGVTPEVILSQTALETGWGKHIISNGQQSSFNLFNIKADQNWRGERMEKSSMEFLQGKTLQQKSDFRVYGSFEQSFDDYVNFLQNNPRYKNALEKTAKAEQSLHDEAYIKTLHKAGYATDPAYANKVLRVLNSEAIQNQVLNSVKLASK